MRLGLGERGRDEGYRDKACRGRDEVCAGGGWRGEV